MVKIIKKNAIKLLFIFEKEKKRQHKKKKSLRNKFSSMFESVQLYNLNVRKHTPISLMHQSILSKAEKINPYGTGDLVTLT